MKRPSLLHFAAPTSERRVAGKVWRGDLLTRSCGSNGPSGRTFSSGSRSNRLNLMFLGPPGVGKGTYAAKIGPALGVPVISTGDIIRRQIKAKTALASQLERYTNKGALVPDEIVLEMVRLRLLEDDCAGGYLLDGFPRNVQQAKLFHEVSELDLVTNINIPEWVLTEKILGRRVCSHCGTGYNLANIYCEKEGLDMPPLLPRIHGVCDVCGNDELLSRDDDTPDVIQHRLRVYHGETAPLVNHYQEKGILIGFEVKKGLNDVPRLLDHILQFLQQRVDVAMSE